MIFSIAEVLEADERRKGEISPEINPAVEAMLALLHSA